MKMKLKKAAQLLLIFTESHTDYYSEYIYKKIKSQLYKKEKQE
jgi:hypothetical protein